MVRRLIGLLVALVALAGARVARTRAQHLASSADAISLPFTPSASAAPFLSLGFREAAADLLYVRMIGYAMENHSSGHVVADLAESIVTLDPNLRRAYTTAANAATLASRDVNNRIVLRAISLLELGSRRFPDDWRMPHLAGQMYTQDLKTEDAQQKHSWDEKGTLLIESAIRKPGAPVQLAAWAATMRTKLGQHERAVRGLREMLLVTPTGAGRNRLIHALAELEQKDAESLAAEINRERREFEQLWKEERPSVSATMYVLLGPRQARGFDMVDLATGGRSLVERNELVSEASD